MAEPTPINWDTSKEPEPVHGRRFTLEHVPLSELKGWHKVNREYAGKVLDRIRAGESIDALQANDDNSMRDGHHRQLAVLMHTRDPDHKVPVWRLTPEGPVDEPAKFAAAQAPAGGAIVNRQFTTGGRFLPGVLKRIADVRRKRAKVAPAPTAKLAREEHGLGPFHADREYNGIMRSIGAEPDEASHYARLADLLQEQGDPLHAVARRAHAARNDRPTVSAWGAGGDSDLPTTPYVEYNYMHPGPGTDDVDHTRVHLTVRKNGGRRWIAAGLQHWHPGGQAFMEAPVTLEEARAILRFHHSPGGRYPALSKLGNEDTEKMIHGEPKPTHVFGHPIIDADHTKLARDLSPMAAQKFLPPGTMSGPRQTLHDHEIRAIEDAHALEEHERLTKSKSYKHHSDGTVSASVDHVAAFFDALARKRLPAAGLHEILNDPHVAPERKIAHVFHHAHDEADADIRRMNNGMDWYKGAVKKMEAALHHIFSREDPGNPQSKHVENHPLWGRYNKDTGIVTPGPGMRLAKAVIAFTSGNTEPVQNLAAAVRAIKSGIRKDPADPFRSMDRVDHDRFRRWLDHAKAETGHEDPGKVTNFPPKTRAALRDSLRWVRKFGHLDNGEGTGYQGAPVFLDTQTGRIVAFSKPGGGYKAAPGITVDEVKALKEARRLKPMDIPVTGKDGRLVPKGWGNRASNIGKAIDLLDRVISHHGGNHELAAQWLEAAHDRKKHLAEVSGKKTIDRGDLDGGEPIPGSFIFGPKFGPFFQNLSENPQHVTMDKWWSRTVYRYLGAILDAETGERREAPASKGDRVIMREAAVDAAKQLSINPADLQAVLWYHEQRLWRLFGARNESNDFAIAGKEALRQHGFPPEFDPSTPQAGGGTGSPGPNAAAGGSVPSPARRNPKGFGRPRRPGPVVEKTGNPGK
jgi:hypothetical protein